MILINDLRLTDFQLFSNCYTDFAPNFQWMFVKIGVQPLFFMELWVILCNFWPILKKSTIKPLTRNHSYLVQRVQRTPSF